MKDKIKAMEPYGYTSIENGTKWAAALLDPSLQSIVADLSKVEGSEYLSKPAIRGAPLNYDEAGVRKYLIVMSDGENTRNWDIESP